VFVLRGFLIIPIALMLFASAARAQSPVLAKEIIAACQAERAQLPDRDRSAERKAAPQSATPQSATPQSATGQTGGVKPELLACKEFLVGYFKATLSAEALARANAAPSPEGVQKVCIRLPDFVPFQELADILLDYAKARPDETSLPAKALADQAFAARYPCPGR
jgi:hypothetical protein